MTTVPVTAERLYGMLVSEYPQVPALVSEMNAVTLAQEKPKAANLIDRVLSASSDRAGRSKASAFIENMIRATGVVYASQQKRALLPPARKIKDSTREHWNHQRTSDIARIWATRNAAQDIGLPFKDIFPDASLSDWLHETYLPTRMNASYLYRDGHWNAITLLHVFLMTKNNYPVLEISNVTLFMLWAEKQNDLKTVATIITERNTIDPKHLAALLETSGSLAAPVRSGAL